MDVEEERFSEDVPQELKEAEKLLGNRCSDFVIIINFDDRMSWVVSRKTNAYGLLCRVKQQIENSWDHEDMEDLDKEF